MAHRERFSVSGAGDPHVNSPVAGFRTQVAELSREPLNEDFYFSSKKHLKNIYYEPFMSFLDFGHYLDS